jgi:undecaprenyl-diphosphatase
MPSPHAVNNFAAGLFLAKIFPKYKSVFLAIATTVAISRPIVGVHYFSDILVGGTIGAVLGYIMGVAALKLDNYFEDKLNKKIERL